MLKLYCYDWNSRISDSEKISKVVRSIEEIWNRTGIPVRGTSSIRLKVKNVIEKFKNILEARSKSSMTQVKRENEFISKYSSLFDVVQQKPRVEICPIKMAFLNDQRCNRIQTLNDLNVEENNDDGISIDFDNVSADSHDSISSSDSDYSQGSDDSDSNYSPSDSDVDERIPKKKLKKETIECLNSARLSYRQMNIVARAFIAEFNENPNDYCIGASTFHSNTTKIHQEIAKGITDALKNSSSKIVLLFDSKTCNQLNAAHLKKEKRLAIVLYSEGSHFGLGVNCIKDGKADTLSTMLWDVTTELNLSSRLIGLVCDTENTNIGFCGGTCAKFETKVEKYLLRLCCRHHVMEIVLKRVCETLLSTTQTPQFTFEGSDKLKNQWENIDKSDYQPLDEEELTQSTLLRVLRDQALEQISNNAINPGLRDDYAELNDLCLKLLGRRTSKTIRVIGAQSKARWMSRALLIAKTYLLREYLDLNDEIVRKLERICIFICCLYTKYWNRAPNAIDAPVNDFHFVSRV